MIITDAPRDRAISIRVRCNNQTMLFTPESALSATADDYFKEHGVRMFLNQIDYSGRIGIKGA